MGRRSGFSLIEALVVLAIGGMTLAIIFSIGIRAGDTGFTLGRRALTVADSDVAVSDARSVIRSFVLRPTTTFRDGVDSPVVGGPETLRGEVVMERATQCGPQGWAGPMTLSITQGEGVYTLVCSANGQDRTLMTMRGEAPKFEYSLNRTLWTPSYTNAPERVGGARGDLAPLTVYVRMRSEAGDVLESMTSGRPELWVRLDE